MPEIRFWHGNDITFYINLPYFHFVANAVLHEQTQNHALSLHYKWIDLYNELEKQYDSMYDENENSTAPEEVLYSMILKTVRAKSLVLECILNDRRDIEFDTSLMNFLDQKVFN